MKTIPSPLFVATHAFDAPADSIAKILFPNVLSISEIIDLPL